MFYPLESRINGLITIRRDRLLPRAGDLLVKVGDAVSPEDIIGRTTIHPRWHYVDVAGALKVAPDAVEQYLAKHPGHEVEACETLAVRKSGLFKRVCKSPAGGTIVALEAGHLLIEEPGEMADLRALLPGRVTQILPERGAVIETRGGLIKAAWSSGHSACGVLKMLSDAPVKPLQVEQIDIRRHGAILAAGWCANAEALRQADQMQAHGIILGSMGADLIPLARQLALPIVLVEGFGDIPMDAAAFQLLKSHDGNEISLICPDGLADAGPPEIILPTAAAETAPVLLPPAELQVGQIVRVVGYPRPGSVGRISAMSTVPRRLESGALYQGVEVELESLETAFVPWMNVEPIG